MPEEVNLSQKGKERRGRDDTDDGRYSLLDRLALIQGEVHESYVLIFSKHSRHFIGQGVDDYSSEEKLD